MFMETDNLFNNDLIKILEKSSMAAIDSAIAEAEKRLDIWLKNGYYERVVLLANMAEQMPNKTDGHFQLINFEINKLLKQSSVEIGLL